MDRSSGHGPRRPISRRLLLALVPLLVVLEVPGVVELLQRPELGWKLRQTTVMVVEADGPAARAGVQVSDRVLALGHTRVESWADVRAALTPLRAGESIDLTLRRGDQGLVLPVELARQPLDVLLRTLSLRLSALTFLFLGFITYLRRDDELGRTFFVTCVLLAFPFLDLPSMADRNWVRLAAGLRDGLQALLGAFLLRFLLIFPEGVRSRPELYARQRWLLAPALAILPLHVGSALAPRAAARSGLETGLLTITTLLFAAYVIAGFFVFVRKTRPRDRWIRGSKLRLAALGLGAGVLPLTLATLVRLIAPTHALPVDEWAVLMLPLVPASFSLALLRTGAIDLATLTRQSLVAVFVAGPSLLAAWFLAGAVAGHVDPTVRPAVYGIVLAVVVVLAWVARAPARAATRVVDHVLFPERRRVRAVADRMSRALTERRDASAVVDHFVSGMKDLVDTDVVLVLEPRGDRWIPADPHAGNDEVYGVAADVALIAWIVRAREVVVLDSDRQRHDERFGPASHDWIHRVDAQVVAPLVAAGEVTALLVLGRRIGERSYGALHLYHVDSLCRQAGAALQNARLHEEDLHRERVRIELELAKEIQERLLPDAPLVLDSMTLCGRTVSSRSVGGDLHDHFVLSDGSIVVAVADASGKGIPASLLTSGVRTAVRETIRPGGDLAASIAHVNQHVQEMTQLGHFVALFCGVLDPKSSVLEYCVAGIEPPLWVHGATGRIERLTRGGPVLGVDPRASYRVGTIHLAPGDTVVAYTDGVIDEEDAEGREFGLDALIDLLIAQRSADPVALLETVFDRVKTHAGGDAVDDTTVVVVRRAREVPAGTKAASA